MNLSNLDFENIIFWITLIITVLTTIVGVLETFTNK